MEEWREWNNIIEFVSVRRWDRDISILFRKVEIYKVDNETQQCTTSAAFLFCLVFFYATPHTKHPILTYDSTRALAIHVYLYMHAIAVSGEK